MWRNRLLIPVMVVLLALVAACGSGGSEATATSESTAGETSTTEVVEDLGTVVAGIGSDVATLLYIVGAEQGFFEDHGVTVEVRQFASGVEAIQAQIAGDVHLTSVTELPAIRARQQGGDLVIVGTMGRSDDNFGLVVADTIEEPSDLQEARIGLTMGSGGQYFQHRFAEFHGLDEASLDITNIAVSDLVAAFSRGDIDAYFTWTPNLDPGVAARPGAKILARGGDNDLVPTVMYIMMRADVAANEPLAKAILAGLIDASDWVKANTDEATQVVADVFQSTPEALAPIVGIWNYDVGFSQSQVDSLKSVAAWLLESGELEEEPAWDEFVQPDILRSIDPARVTVTS